MVLAGLLLVPGLATLWTAWQKFSLPVAPDAVPLTLTGMGALAINMSCAFMLARYRDHRGSLTRAAFLSARNDALANVAAAMSEIEQDWKLETMPIASWDRAMAVNLRGSMLCAKHSIPSMLARGGGAIVNFSSTAGIRGDIGLFAYSTSKAGLLGLTIALATTYGKQNIRCNAVSPGSVWTEATKTGLGDRLDMMARTRATARLGIPEDIGHTVVFLCSDKAAYITGQNIVVDGGGTSHQPWVHMK